MLDKSLTENCLSKTYFKVDLVSQYSTQGEEYLSSLADTDMTVFIPGQGDFS